MGGDIGTLITLPAIVLNMAEQTGDPSEYESYRDTIATHAIDAFPERYDGVTYSASDALSEVVFEVADEWLAYDANVSDAMMILQESPNDPDEWEPFAEGKDDWEEIVKAIAFTVIRQDLYDELEERGYLDNWQPTEKLRAVGTEQRYDAGDTVEGTRETLTVTESLGVPEGRPVQVYAVEFEDGTEDTLTQDEIEDFSA